MKVCMNLFRREAATECSPGRQPWFDFRATQAAKWRLTSIRRPCGAVTYMNTNTQRLRAGLSSHAASRLRRQPLSLTAATLAFIIIRWAFLLRPVLGNQTDLQT